MKRQSGVLALVAAACLAAAPASVADSSTLIKDAKVLSSDPIIETAYEPYEQCTSELRKKSAKRDSNTAGQVAGGLVGGGLGSLAGEGSGKDAAAALGAVIGSEVLDPGNGGITEGEIIGAIAGGVIGNQVGKGSGKTAATASGALIGKIVGGNLQENSQQSAGAAPAGYERTRVCRQAEREKKVITGYTVQYLYDGTVFTSVLPYDPGETVKVAVDIDIIEEPRY